jgi:hypothetical protein
MSPFVKYALFVLLGIGVGSLFTAATLTKRIAQQNATIEDLKQEASKRFAATGNSMVTGENYEMAQKAIRLQHETIEKLKKELAEEKHDSATWQKIDNSDSFHLKECLQNLAAKQ